MAWRTLRQKAVADDRAEWWKRTQWALDRALDEDEDGKALGLAALDVLARSELARNEELELLDIAWKSVNGAEEYTGIGPHVSAKVSNSAPLPQHRVQVTAARLRVRLDERLGRTTPPGTTALANEAL
jgi:hypothetical protein